MHPAKARLGIAAAALLVCAAGPKTARDPRWAVPLSRPGLDNLFQVTPGLYRGAQPAPSGYEELSRLGIRTVVNLRAFHSGRKATTGAGLGYERIEFDPSHAEDGQVRRFLQIVTAQDRQPVFVHCMRGADRTGMMIAVYRVCVQGWSKDDAIDEMRNGGYRFDEAWQNLIDWVRGFDPGGYPECTPR